MDDRISVMNLSRFDTEFSRFLIAGATNTLVSYLIYWLLLFALNYNLAFTLTYMIGIAFSYFLQSHFVFRKKLALKKFLAFPSVYIIQYVVSLLLLNLFVAWMNILPEFALAFVIIITIPLTFIMSRTIIKSGMADE